MRMMASWERDSVLIGNESVTGGSIFTQSVGPSHTATVVGALVMLVFFVEGMLGNLWILLAVLSRRSMWNIINLFIASLCFNELLTAGLIVGLIIDSYIWQQWTAGELMCKLNPEFTVAFTGCSLWHTAFIAIHRYIVVCHNNAYKQMSKTAYVTFVLVVARLIPFACTFPGFSLQTSGYVPKMLRCILLPNQGTRILTITIIQILLPCIIVVLCYILVCGYVCKMPRVVTNSNLIQQREIQITKMFFVIFMMILLGFIPYAAVRNADKSNQLSADIYVIVTVFYGIATCSSPLIYGAMSTEIRSVCMSCVAQTFSCAFKCVPCDRLREGNRMLSLSQMADADVSPLPGPRNVQVKDATTQIENGTAQSKVDKCKANGCDVLTCEQEIEPLYTRSRCFSIEEEECCVAEPESFPLNQAYTLRQDNQQTQTDNNYDNGSNNGLNNEPNNGLNNGPKNGLNHGPNKPQDNRTNNTNIDENIPVATEVTYTPDCNRTKVSLFRLAPTIDHSKV